MTTYRKTDKFDNSSIHYHYDTKVNERKIAILHVDQREKTNIQGRVKLFSAQRS